MYQKKMYEQQKLEIPFGVDLDSENRWVKLAEIMPWEKIDQIYSKNFDGEKGKIAKTSRLAFGALYIKKRLNLSDEETVNQIRENPSMQYFCGYEAYATQKPFDPSLMVRFRKRIDAKMMGKITKEAFAEAGKKEKEVFSHLPGTS